MFTRRCLTSTFVAFLPLSLFLLMVGCAPKLKLYEGSYPCQEDNECPENWVCRAGSEPSPGNCYSEKQYEVRVVVEGLPPDESAEVVFTLNDTSSLPEDERTEEQTIEATLDDEYTFEIGMLFDYPYVITIKEGDEAVGYPCVHVASNDENSNVDANDPDNYDADVTGFIDKDVTIIKYECAIVCGDGIAAGSEEFCDDGNNEISDGCNEFCEVEPGWICTGTSSVCSAVCGDGMIVGTEQCDDGNTDAGDGCSKFCKIEAGWNCVSSDPPSECVM